jgi:diaminohydroxyphosphoribosylaminopyrimidine deaminase/5-amino-6-(5-phosphoribosylamino)uracil reductase
MRDPNPVVAGRGLEILRKANIRVDVGLFRKQARQLNEAFCRRVVDNRPWVILKSAVSLDGKIATASGDSRWISSPESRAHAHTLRDQVDAILVGIGTVMVDNPRLTTRLKSGKGRDPTRVILDSKLQIPLKAKALNQRTETDIIIATTARADGRRAQELRGQGVEVWVLPSEKGRVSLRRLLSQIAERGITTLLVEGGGEVAGSFLRQGLVDRVCYYLAPLLVGGDNAPGPLKGKGAAKLSGAWEIRGVSVTPLGPDLLVEGYVRSRKKDERNRSA